MSVAATMQKAWKTSTCHANHTSRQAMSKLEDTEEGRRREVLHLRHHHRLCFAKRDGGGEREHRDFFSCKSCCFFSSNSISACSMMGMTRERTGGETFVVVAVAAVARQWLRRRLGNVAMCPVHAREERGRGNKGREVGTCSCAIASES